MPTNVQILKDMTVFSVDRVDLLGQFRDIRVWNDGGGEGIFLWAECFIGGGRETLFDYLGEDVYVMHDMGGTVMRSTANIVSWKLSAPSGEGNHYVVTFDERPWLRERRSLWQRAKRWLNAQLDMRCAIDAAIERLEVNIGRPYDGPNLIVEEFTLKFPNAIHFASGPEYTI